MRTVDDFLQDLLRAKQAFNSDEFALANGYEHSDVIVYMNKVKAFNENWVALFVRSEQGPCIFMLDYDYEKEISQFIDSGGFKNIEEAEKRKERLEIENLVLIKAQQKEIEENKKRQKLTMLLSILAIGISIAAIVVQYITVK